ncbi:MAG: beta-propeller domain-containing protein, partial [Clostridia bacterium]|nr:beta-propeller domain-containing protein [Clostridia bacterium]
MTTVNSLRVLDKDLKEVGKIENIAPDERVYSVRFMGDTAYFVTFRQVDTLFSVDLKNPKEPKIIGALKIPGFSNYLFPFGEDKLLGIGQDADEKTGRTGGIKFSIFDISNPANVTESAKTVLKYFISASPYGTALVTIAVTFFASIIFSDP